MIGLASAISLVALAGCAESSRDSGGGGDDDTTSPSDGADPSAGASGGTFIFAGSADPVTLDPFFASDGESFRPARQIFEGLVGTEPGTADPAPLLATEWETSEDGLSNTFQLQDGVTFHDGADFNGTAACWNFDRWYNTPPGVGQTEDQAYYWISLFKGFAKGELTDSVYESCTVDSETEITVKLTEPFAGFVAALSLPAFSMQSPDAIEQYGATGQDDPSQSAYATEHPTGTGPFVFESWVKEDQIVLTRNDDYWGEPALLEQVQIVPIAEPKARADALLAGEIDGFDLVGPADIPRLEDEGYQILNRPAFNVLYLGFNQAVKPLDDILVRQAIAHAIDKDAVISASMPEGTAPALEFVPETVEGYTEDVPTYEFDPEKAKDLLAEAGAEDLELEFNYPTDVTRPYMPSPGDTFNAIRSQLEAVGITVKPSADVWDPDYLDKISGSKDHGIHLLGWTGDYNDTDNFLGVFFGRKSSEWGFDNPELFQALNDARGLPTVEEQIPVYEEINRQVMEFLPGIPLASPVPSLGFAPNVKGYVPSPVQDEPWNLVSVEE
ncbi:MAG: ABC transporter substrate-binding protein [Nocardioidaceae bacterium]|nr:ABC transporter substrate-binding protein [Nocardioidaceae bacterium]